MQCFMARYLDLLHLICIKHITCPSSSIDWWDKKADKKVQIKPGIHLTEQFMCSGFKYCENECNFYMEYCNPISLQFCTCHDSFAVVTSANLWPDWIIGTEIRAEEISTRFQLWAHTPLELWVPVPFPSLIMNHCIKPNANTLLRLIVPIGWLMERHTVKNKHIFWLIVRTSS